MSRLITHLRHVDLAVPDYDRQLEFYSGVWGLTEGFSMMAGGDPEAYKRIEPLLQALAPSPARSPRARSRSRPSRSTATWQPLSLKKRSRRIGCRIF